VRTPDRYVELVEQCRPTEASGETLDDATRRIEGLQLALRMRDGVPDDALDGGELGGLVDRIGDRWVLTRSGRLLANEISLRLH
jgi:coproporphyrinogen III oxidase-like Fe-S oxidoreductase